MDHIEEGLDNINNEMKVNINLNVNININKAMISITKMDNINNEIKVAEKALKKMGRFCGLCTAPWRR